MPRRVAKAGEGGANGYGVYGFIRDLIMEGKDAEFVDNRGRYRLNWPRALDRYAHYKAKKKPDLKRTNQTNRRADSNRLRSALLNSYKKEGAREHKESKKVNENDQVVERQFQMPPRVFEALFSDAKLSDSNEEQDEQDGKRHLSEGADGAQASHESSSDAGFDETMDLSFDFSESPDSLVSTSRGNILTNPSLDDSTDVESEGPGTHFSDSAFQITQIFDEDSVEAAVEEFFSESDEKIGFMGVVRDIFPASGPVKEAVGTQASHESSSDTGFETIDLSFGSPDSLVLTSLGNVIANPSLDDSTDVESEGPGTHFSDSAFQITQIFDEDSVESAVEEIVSEPDEIFGFMGVVCDISPASGPVKTRRRWQLFATMAPCAHIARLFNEGGYYFEISLSEPLSDNVSSGVAEFEGVGTVALTKLDPFKLFGLVPASDRPRDVQVKVLSQSGECLGWTWFHYVNKTREVNEMREMVKQLIHDPKKLSSFMTIWSQECHFYGFEMQLQGNVDSTTQAKQKQLVKILELLVYTAAQTGAKQFIEMIFSTSAQRIVFDSYKERATLPEDVARANGHCNLAEYLQDINTRLTKEVGDEPKSIDWLELLKAVQNQVSASQDKESKKEKTPVENDDYSSNYFADYSSDYFADDETSSCGLFEHDDEFTSNPEGKDPAEKASNQPGDVRAEVTFPRFPCGKCYISPDEMKENERELHIAFGRTVSDFPQFPGETSSKRAKCRSVSRIKKKKGLISTSTCRFKRPARSRQFKVHERHLNQELGIFEKSIGDESVHSPSTLLPRCSVLNKSPQSSCGASLHGLSSGNVSWTKESKIKELKMERVRSWSSGNPNSEEFPSAEGGTSSERTKCRSVSRIQEEKRLLMTENAVISASTCRLKRPACSRLPKVHERHLNQELGIFEKSIGDESVHSPSTLLPSCSVLNNSPPQTDSSAYLHGVSYGNVSGKNESNIKELKMERVRSWLSCNRNSEEFPSAEGETPSKRTKCRCVFKLESKEEKRVLTTENAFISASTCRLKRPACSRLPKVHEKHLNQELGIFEKSIGDESVHSPSPLLNNSTTIQHSDLSNSTSLHGLSSGNVSWKKESNIKELKMERVSSWSSSNPNSEEFLSTEGDGRVVSLVGC
ncbi:uncharacterized protein [Acropora muricata]|uniref:uncharacterized protein isoform X4 n=1 Tax=Acropora muricata TaxID=159855 RepID=UPI0034E4E130